MPVEFIAPAAATGFDFGGGGPSTYRTANTPGAVKGKQSMRGNRAERSAFNQEHFSTPTNSSEGVPGVPGKGSEYKGKSVPGGAENLPTTNTTGSQSGPGILENWFNQRAAGTDPAYEYSMKRAGEDIDRRNAATGSFGGGAHAQQLSDMYANMEARRMGQLDNLAGGASGEHLGRLGLMFNQGLGLAGGQSGLASAYDLGAAGNMDAATRAQMQLNLNKYGVDAAGNQSAINTVTGFWNGGNKK
jgi:hypothetical protein